MFTIEDVFGVDEGVNVRIRPSKGNVNVLEKEYVSCRFLPDKDLY